MSRSLALWAFAGLVGHVTKDDQRDQALAAIAGFTNARVYKTEIRVQALGALGAFGHRSKRHVPEMIKMLDDKDLTVSSAAAAALAQVGTAEEHRIIDAFLSMLNANATPKASLTPQEKSAMLNRAGTAVVGLVNLKANKREVHEVLDRVRENKGVDLGLRVLIEQGQKALTDPPKDADKKDKRRVERGPR
jgi:HEAT repeat protein